MNADCKGALAQINTSWRVFEHKGKKMRRVEVKAILQYAIRKGYEHTGMLSDEEVDDILGSITLPMTQSNEKYTLGYAKIIIAKFMELDSVQVGYADTEEETEWQRNNEEWMNTVGLTQVGRYFVNVKDNKWHKWGDVKYHSSWDWLHPVWEKYKAMNFLNHPLVSDHMANMERISHYLAYRTILETHDAIFKAIQWYNQQKQTHDTR